MTKVIPIASARAGRPVQTTAPSSLFPHQVDQVPGIARQQAIENALSMALYWVRHSEHPGHLRAATVRATRAASMLKQACGEVLAGEGGAR